MLAMDWKSRLVSWCPSSAGPLGTRKVQATLEGSVPSVGAVCGTSLFGPIKCRLRDIIWGWKIVGTAL